MNHLLEHKPKKFKHYYEPFVGGGAIMFMDDKEIETPVRIDCQVIVDYVTDYLKGNLADKYSSTEGRIDII